MNYKCLICALLFFSTYLEAEIPLEKFFVCTVASKNTKTLKQLLQSCNSNGIQIYVMGIDLPYKGNGQKLTYIKNYIRNMPNDNIVLFVDAYDTLILSSKERILKNFLARDTQCVFGAEAQLSPASIGYLRPQFPETPNKFKYLNSGTFIGYVGYLRQMLNMINPIKENQSDQGQLIQYYVKHTDEIQLDYECELFFTLHQIDPSEYSINKRDKNVTCLITNTVPCVIHGNGDGKTAYQRIFNTLFK